MTPAHTHDCKACTYLGTVAARTPGIAGPVDLYHCKNEWTSKDKGGSVVARYTSEGPDYLSAPLWLLRDRNDHHPELLAAAALAEGWKD